MELKKTPKKARKPVDAAILIGIVPPAARSGT
jgi:hypothetical protein